MITVRVAALLAAGFATAASAQSPTPPRPTPAAPSSVPERPAAWTPSRPAPAQIGAPAPSRSQSRPALPAPAIGAPVRDASGDLLGRIEAVVTEGGRPVQVVVRTRGRTGVGARSRAVPVDSLRPDGSGWALPLRRSEFDLLPPLAR